MKRPNGYGSIVKLGGRRRRPYGVQITDITASRLPSSDGTYRQKRKWLGYYATREEAFQALEDYNKNKNKAPADYIGITFEQVWGIYSSRALSNVKPSTANAYRAAFKKCAPIYKRRMTDLRIPDLQAIADAHAGESKSSLNNIRLVMGFVFEWCIKNDILQKDYSPYVEIKPKGVQNHMPLTHAQVNAIVSKPEHDLIDKLAIIYIFTGVRPKELIDLKKSDIHMPEQYFRITAAKTKNGIRIVPIADALLPLFKSVYDSSQTDMFVNIIYTDYLKKFKTLFPGHLPHDTRSTFISFLAEKDVPLVTIQKIVGHKSGNITTDIYTRLSLQPLLSADNKLDYNFCSGKQINLKIV